MEILIDQTTYNLINFIDLTEFEIQQVLAWRNHKDIKKWMYTNENITLEQHLNFINKLQSTNTKLYFVVKQDINYLGVVDFYDIDSDRKECDFGLYANPFEKIAGIGRILEEISIKYAFDNLKLNKLKLEVFTDNERALNLYKKYQFEETNRKIVNEREVICMELNK
jgi:UDP-4-amino-4,6-dideoxy-N-acetyl-beta-L-altrosamine N-acetyltransferase